MRREYTYELYNELVSACNAEDRNALQRIWDNIWNDSWAKIDAKFTSRNYDEVNDDAKAIMKDIIEYKDKTVSELKQIFINEQDLNDKYASQLESKRTDFAILGTYLRCMTEAIDPDSGDFSIDRLKEAFIYQTEDEDEPFFYPDETEEVIVNASATDYIYTDEDIKYFVDKEESIRYFLANQNIRIQYIADIGGWDAFNMAFYGLLNFLSDEAKAIITGLPEAEKRKYLLKLYKENKIREDLTKTIDAMCKNGDSYSKSDYKDAIGGGKEFVGLLKKYGKDWEKYADYDKRTREYKKYKKYMDKVGGVENFLKLIDAYGDAFFCLFEDYEKNLEVIESVKASMEEGGYYSEEFKMAIDDLEKEYTNNFTKALYEASDPTLQYLKKFAEGKIDDLIDEYGSKEFKKKVKKVTNFFDCVGKAGKIIDTAGEYSDYGTQAQARANALVINDYVDQIQKSYEASIKKLQGMSTEDEGFAAAKKNLENNFELLKNTYKDLYAEMAKSESGSKSAYYSFLSKKASMASMKDGFLNLPSYEQYMATYGG